MISIVDINISSPQSEIINGLVSDYIFKNINKIFGITSVQLFNNNNYTRSSCFTSILCRLKVDNNITMMSLRAVVILCVSPVPAVSVSVLLSNYLTCSPAAFSS